MIVFLLLGSSTTLVWNNKKFSVSKKPRITYYVLHIQVNILWHSKGFEVSKRIVLLTILKSILCKLMRNLLSSWRRNNPLYPERGRHGITRPLRLKMIHSLCFAWMMSCLLKFPNRFGCMFGLVLFFFLYNVCFHCCFNWCIYHLHFTSVLASHTNYLSINGDQITVFMFMLMLIVSGHMRSERRF